MAVTIVTSVLIFTLIFGMLKEVFVQIKAISVLGGVDLVLELPFVKAVRSAQDFARGGINLLKNLGVVDTLAFGAEVTDLEKLKLAASTFEEKFFATELRRLMSQGISYAAAVTKILSKVTSLDEKLLRQPNTILAIEYLRALPKNFSPLFFTKKFSRRQFFRTKIFRAKKKLLSCKLIALFHQQS